MLLFAWKKSQGIKIENFCEGSAHPSGVSGTMSPGNSVCTEYHLKFPSGTRTFGFLEHLMTLNLVFSSDFPAIFIYLCKPWLSWRMITNRSNVSRSLLQENLLKNRKNLTHVLAWDSARANTGKTQEKERTQSGAQPCVERSYDLASTAHQLWELKIKIDEIFDHVMVNHTQPSTGKMAGYYMKKRVQYSRDCTTSSTRIGSTHREMYQQKLDRYLRRKAWFSRAENGTHFSRNVSTKIETTH